MPLIPSDYQPPPGLRGGHVQTVLRALLPGARVPPTRMEELDLADGDVLELDWYLPHSREAPLVVLCHGLEGSARSSYMTSMARALMSRGCNVLSWSYRGCGLRPNRLVRSYHSGETEDLEAVMQRGLAVAEQGVALIGFSLGGNLILKYLAERLPPKPLRAAVAVSAPIDLAASADALDLKQANGLYRRRFLRSLKAKAALKVHRFPTALPGWDGSAIHTVRAFDEAFTAPLHGFSGAADYYARCSALPLLEQLSLPVLLLNAADDPLLGPSCFPQSLAATSQMLHLEVPSHGGHLGFLDHRKPWRSSVEVRALDFLLPWLHR
jgi:predicted alpha/beta-fold hydrolase